MASSGYVADTFVAGEQPTTSKWNELWSNDASFNNGNGFNDGIVNTRHIATDAVTGDKIAADAITLGVPVSITTNFETTSTTPVQVTGLSETVTVPAGGRGLELEFSCDFAYNDASGGITTISLWDGAVGTGTQLSKAVVKASAAFSGAAVTLKAYPSPVAGSKTYTVGIQTSASGTAGIEAAATYPATFIVKAR